MKSLAPLLDLCLHTQFSSFGNTLGIPLCRNITGVNKSLRAVRIVVRQAEEVLLACNHHGDSCSVRAKGDRMKLPGRRANLTPEADKQQ